MGHMPRTIRRRGSILLLVGLLSSAVARPGVAAPGDPDTSFGRNGKVTTNFTPRNDMAFGVAIQPDGRIVTSGTAGGRSFALARHRRNGRPDRSFGGNGKVRTRFAGGLTIAYAVALEPTGRIVAAGSTDHENAVALARYGPDGTLDGSFGGDGKVVTTFTGDHDLARDLAIQPDGKIVVAGTASFARFALARFDTDGSLDASFGVGGKVLTDVTGGRDGAHGVAVQPDGRIVVAGRGAGAGGRFALARYLPDGSMDATFGGDGKVLTNFTARHDAARAVTIQANGRIVAAGFAGGRRRGGFALARYLPDGSLDATFGGNGKVRTGFTKGWDLAFGIAVQPDRRIVVAGHAGGPRSSPRDHRFAVARFRPHGALDRSFGVRGKRMMNFTPGDDWAQDLAIQPDGRIVVAGRSNRARGSFALARLTAR